MLLWLLLGVLLIIILILCIKLWSVQNSINEICVALHEQLSHETNILISVSSGDRYIRKLAVSLNRELIILRAQRQRYKNGDHELKNAVTNIAHDLRTPLTAICGYIDLLKRENTSKDVTRYLAFIENRTQALEQLTEEMFRYSVAINTNKELSLAPVSLNSALEESLAAFYVSLKSRNITPIVSIGDAPIIRRLNADALSRVLSNLISNALKYSDGDLYVTLQDNGTIVFTNTAISLDDVQVGRLFERYFSVESARDATGLGLAISKTLVEQMHGTITAQYEANRLSVLLAF